MFVLTNPLIAKAIRGPEGLLTVYKGLLLSLGIGRSRPEQHIGVELESGLLWQNKMEEACFRGGYKVAREEEKDALWQSGKGYLRPKTSNTSRF